MKIKWMMQSFELNSNVSKLGELTKEETFVLFCYNISSIRTIDKDV